MAVIQPGQLVYCLGPDSNYSFLGRVLPHNCIAIDGSKLWFISGSFISKGSAHPSSLEKMCIWTPEALLEPILDEEKIASLILSGY